MNSKPTRRDQLSARVDPEVRKTIERIAADERRPVSNLVRNVLEDWARARARGQEQAA